MEKKAILIVKVGFTYIGTVVGAGFATGQEIIQFFTRFGWIAAFTIILSSVLFIWVGTKIMLLAHDVGAVSYEDLNCYLFGEQIGKWISLFTLVVLFGITTVMLAGAGSIFSEHLQFPYQFGLLMTLFMAYFVIVKGMDAILTVNTIVVPLMILFSVLIVYHTLNSTQVIPWNPAVHLHSMLYMWLAPFLYAAFNLSMAQAVLVPIGAQIQDRSVLYWGGLLGGVGVGLMLLAGHYALSANMPSISQYNIPMGHVIEPLGFAVQLLFILVIFGEIFTTFIANVYGLMLQIYQRTAFNKASIILMILGLCYLVSQIGFKPLLSTLYPVFGCVSLIWLAMIFRKKKQD